jgi:hypothetical protein
MTVKPTLRTEVRQSLSLLAMTALMLLVTSGLGALVARAGA